VKLSGFTLVRNGVKFDYPFLESLRSLLPIVDELVVNVGRGDDDTWQRLRRFDREEGGGKLVLFESTWPLDDPEQRRGGRILSDQTNMALDRCDGDWCLYLQADEVLHESEASLIRASLEYAHSRPEVDGLLFDYRHFYGSFDVIQETRSAYRREIRAIRRQSGARSIGDAQSFRLPNGAKVAVIRSGARVYHYGWVRTPEAMRAKTTFMDTLYHGESPPAAAGQPHTGDNCRYKKFFGLKPFEGTHPSVMRERIASKGWRWNLEESPLEWRWQDSKKIILDWVEFVTGYRLFEYRSYRLIDERRSSRKEGKE